ncbi:ubiquitin-like protein, partial [Rozella allomycis CSF55]
AQKKNVELPKLDESQPTTNVQIRLSDGWRLVVKLNQSHPVSALYDFVSANRQESRPFVLQIAMPPKQLQHKNKTLKDEGVINTTVMQRFI